VVRGRKMTFFGMWYLPVAAAVGFATHLSAHVFCT
jgi:hypothetical protein